MCGSLLQDERLFWLHCDCVMRACRSHIYKNKCRQPINFYASCIQHLGHDFYSHSASPSSFFFFLQSPRRVSFLIKTTIPEYFSKVLKSHIPRVARRLLWCNSVLCAHFPLLFPSRSSQKMLLCCMWAQLKLS